MSKMRFSGRAVLASAAAFAVSAGAVSSAQAALEFGQTVALDEIGQWDGVLSTPPLPPARAAAFVFAGNQDIPISLPPLTVSGKAIAPIAVNFAGETVLDYTISAPAGQRYRITLPAGGLGSFGFKLNFDSPTSQGVTLVPPEAVSFKLDGVPQAFKPSSSGIDPAGRSVLIEGYQTEEQAYTSSFAFSTLTLSIDYSVDSGGIPLDVADTLGALTATEDSFIAFSGGSFDLDLPVPTITLEPVPEPASLALLALGTAAFATRRR